jgi:competence protein ComEA
VAVHVVGAVPRPGLYEFAKGARVQDAIDAAGGLLAEANVDSLNLAALLEDGQQLVIPYKDGSGTSSDSGTVNLPSSESAVPTAETATSSNSSNADLVNINTASLDELIALPSIGPTIAQKIIDYRNENGAFSTIEDIMNVSGVGPSIFEDIKDLITV